MQMNGEKQLSLYFHIPFCSRKCPYCHFFVLPNHVDTQKQLVHGLLKEWQRILPQINDAQIVSIYFGGGTPTLLESAYLEKILTTIHSTATVSKQCEITIEANPENVTPSLMENLHNLGINRVSIGVQSLEDDLLKILERTHNASKAIQAIEQTYAAGIKNISIDLMYDLPTQTTMHFKKTLQKLGTLPITHLSLYNLTIEPNTAFHKRQEKLMPLLPSSEESLHMLEAAEEQLEKIGLLRYEISAFARQGFFSHHNTGYWTARPFFGLGPSAFSFFEGKRLRNIAHLRRYCELLDGGNSPVDFEEQLPFPNNVHELLAIELRLFAGVDVKNFQKRHGDLPASTHALLTKLCAEGLLQKKDHTFALSQKGRLFYDTIAEEII